MGGIRIRGLFCFLGFHLLLEYVCPFCHIADDGNGDGTDAVSYTHLKVKAIHAGLECGLFLDKYPALDMMSFGPTLQGVYSPDERMLIPTVQKFWDHLLDILKHIPVK